MVMNTRFKISDKIREEYIFNLKNEKREKKRKMIIKNARWTWTFRKEPVGF